LSEKNKISIALPISHIRLLHGKKFKIFQQCQHGKPVIGCFGLAVNVIFLLQNKEQPASPCSRSPGLPAIAASL